MNFLSRVSSHLLSDHDAALWPWPLISKLYTSHWVTRGVSNVDANFGLFKTFHSQVSVRHKIVRLEDWTDRVQSATWFIQEQTTIKTYQIVTASYLCILSLYLGFLLLDNVSLLVELFLEFCCMGLDGAHVGLHLGLMLSVILHCVLSFGQLQFQSRALAC